MWCLIVSITADLCPLSYFVSLMSVGLLAVYTFISHDIAKKELLSFCVFLLPSVAA